ncbi:MAG TPA: glycosyltransferase [Candidatus Saccharimonadales bacterium]|nr:glycosyltransferase [Candidatus Saccharimonadales bacterium]
MISIIIIVKNDRRIVNVLRDLKTIRKPEKTEVIVVDASKGKLQDIKEKFTYVTWIDFESKTKKRITIPEQRNVGIYHAKGNIIVFIDSDCKPDKNWLEELTKPIRYKSEEIVAGIVKLEDEKSMHNLEQNKNLQKKYLTEAPTMNIAVSRKVYDQIGTYDENFQFGSDVDFSWRATRAGFKIRFNDNAIIYHDLGDTKHEIRRMYFYGKARTRLYKKHRYRLRFFWGNEFLTIFYPLYFIFLPITIIFYFYPLLILLPLLKYRNQNPLRFILMKTIYGAGVLKPLILPE